MRIGHISDLHYCPRYLEEVDRCTAHAIDTMRAADVDQIIVTGDGFDQQIDANQPAYLALCRRMREIADLAPAVYLQGTFSHDFPGTVGVFRLFGGKYPIHVSERIEQVAWTGTEFVASGNWRFDEIPEGTEVLYTCLPSINRADIAARLGVEAAAMETREVVAELLRSFSAINLAARKLGIPTIFLSHGTVVGALTEHGVPMAGLDHEFTSETLFATQASGIALGHIHKQQAWTHEGRCCAYAGSVGRLHFGEVGEKGGLIWEVGAEKSSATPFHTPARRMIDIEFAGVPDMEALRARVEDAKGAHVRIMWNVDEEHRDKVDRRAIAALFEGAAEVKLDGRINPILRSRTEGVSKLADLASQLSAWAEATKSEPAGLAERLARLRSEPAEAVVKAIVGGDQQKVLKEAA